MKKLVTTTLAMFALLLVGPACEAEAGSSDPVVGKITDQLKSIGTAIDGVDSEEAAKTANTTITDLVSKISVALTAAKVTGGDTLTQITDLITSEKDGLLSKLNGLDAKYKPAVQAAIDQLTALGK